MINSLCSEEIRQVHQLKVVIVVKDLEVRRGTWCWAGVRGDLYMGVVGSDMGNEKGSRR